MQDTRAITESSQNEEPIGLYRVPLYSVRDGHLDVDGWGQTTTFIVSFASWSHLQLIKSPSPSPHFVLSIEAKSTVLH